jgi:hypothetical protein
MFTTTPLGIPLPVMLTIKSPKRLRRLGNCWIFNYLITSSFCLKGIHQWQMRKFYEKQNKKGRG